MTPINLEDLVDRFDVFLLDQFGVMVDGVGAYDGAVKAVEHLIAAGKTLIVLTNSGKRSSHTAKRLARAGYPMDNIAVISSGEVARTSLADRIADQGQHSIWYEADSSGASPLDGLDAVAAECIEEADLLLIAGIRSDEIALDDFEVPFRKAVERSIPCICTNPDRRRLTPHGIRFAAGSIAELYESLGGQVDWIGKPYSSIYRRAIDLIDQSASVVCVGDSVAHDIRGAADAGLASALVRTGLNAGRSLQDIEADCEHQGVEPDFLLDGLTLSPRGQAATSV